MGMGMGNTSTGSGPALQGDDIDAGGGWSPASQGSASASPNATGNPNLTDKQQMILKMMSQALAQAGKGGSVQAGGSMGSQYQNGTPGIQTLMGGQTIPGSGGTTGQH